MRFFKKPVEAWPDDQLEKLRAGVRKADDLLLAIFALEDDEFYTVNDVPRMVYQPDTIEYDALKAYVGSIRSRANMVAAPSRTVPGEGNKKAMAWRGRVWKSQLEDNERKLAEYLLTTDDWKKFKKMRQKGPLQWLWHARRTVVPIACMLFFVVAGIWALQKTARPDISGKAVYRVAMVPSYQSAADGMVAVMVYDLLPKPEFQTVPLHLLEADKKPDYQALSEALGVDFLLYGHFQESGPTTVWNGILWTPAYHKKIKALGAGVPAVANEIVGLVKGAIAGAFKTDDKLLFSGYAEANLLYAEGSKSLAEGEYTLAGGMFRKTLAYDPDFALAAHKYAGCLRTLGQNREAGDLLERLAQSQEGELANRAYLDLLEWVVFAESDYDYGIALAEQAMSRTDDHYYQYRFQLNLLRFEAMAGCQMDQVPPPPLETPDLEFEYLFTLGYLAYDARDNQAAINYFKDAIALSLDLELGQKVFIALDKLARTYWRLTDLKALEELLLELERLTPLAHKSGNQSARLLIDYWTVMVESRWERGARMEHALMKVADRARILGVKDIEVWSTIQWFDLQYQDKYISKDCEIALRELIQVSDGFRPFHRAALFMRLYMMHRTQGDNVQAKQAIETADQIARDYQLPPLIRAAALNDFGWVLYLLGELELAQEKFLEAKQVVPPNHPLLNTISWNLNKVGEDLGNAHRR